MTEQETPHGDIDLESAQELERFDQTDRMYGEPDDLTPEEIETLEYKQDVIALLQAFYDQCRVEDDESRDAAGNALIDAAMESNIIADDINEEDKKNLLHDIELWTSDELATTRYGYPHGEDISPEQSSAFDAWAQSLEAYYFAQILNNKISPADAQQDVRTQFLEYIATTLGHDVQDDDGSVVEPGMDASREQEQAVAVPEGTEPEPLSHQSSILSGSGKEAVAAVGSGKQAPPRPGSGKQAVTRPGSGKAAMPMMRAKKRSAEQPNTTAKQPVGAH